MEQTIDRVATILKEQGPFDGILGFSQGGALAGVLACLKHQGDPRFATAFNFAVLCAGFIPRDGHARMMFERGGKVKVPALLIAGTKDQMYQLHEETVSLFDRDTTVTVVHPGGHVVPKLEGEEAAKVRAFFEQQRSRAAKL
eukprot:GDKI01014142.1.p2 GENE.GDKI01014142.1~~GDKI01014142.1.p2  ORF type:complete len:142 (+),score=34.35 GDKI01014142.1:313-738(+)